MDLILFGKGIIDDIVVILLLKFGNCYGLVVGVIGIGKIVILMILVEGFL